MNEWERSFAETPLHQLLEDSRRVARELSGQDATDGASREILDRTAVVLEYIASRVNGTPPDLIAREVLNRLQGHAQAISEFVTAYSGDHNPAHMEQARSRCDQLLEAAALLPDRVPRNAAAAKKYFAHIADLEGQASGSLAELRALIDQVKSDLETSVASTVADFRTQGQAIADRASVVDAEIQTSRTSFQQTISEQSARIDEFVKSGSDRLRAAESQFQTDAKESLNTAGTDWASKTTEMEAAWGERQQELNDRKESILEFLEGRRAEVNKILGATAAEQTAGAYIDEANAQRKQAYLWAVFSILIWFGAIALGWYSMHEVAQELSDLTTPQIVALGTVRIGVSGVAVTFAFLMTGRASEHFERERRARRLANELATLRPFLAELDDEVVHKQIDQAARRYFPGSGIPDSVGERSGGNPN